MDTTKTTWGTQEDKTILYWKAELAWAHEQVLKDGSDLSMAAYQITANRYQKALAQINPK